MHKALSDNTGRYLQTVTVSTYFVSYLHPLFTYNLSKKSKVFQVLGWKITLFHYAMREGGHRTGYLYYTKHVLSLCCIYKNTVVLTSDYMDTQNLLKIKYTHFLECFVAIVRPVWISAAETLLRATMWQLLRAKG